MIKIYQHLWAGLWYLFTVIIFLVRHYHGWMNDAGMIAFLFLSMYHTFCFARSLDRYLSWRR